MAEDAVLGASTPFGEALGCFGSAVHELRPAVRDETFEDASEKLSDLLESDEGDEGALKPKQTQRLLKCLVTARVLGQSNAGNGWLQRLDQEILAVVKSADDRLPILAAVLTEVAAKVTLSRERLSAVELASSVLSAHVDAAAASAALEAVNGGEFGGWECSVLAAQLAVLEGMAHGKPAMLQRAARSQRNLLGKVPELLSLGIALGTVAKSPCAGSSFVAMSVLGLYCLEIDAERFQSEFKPVLLQLYTDSTFGSSTPQPKHVLQSFAPLLRTLTHEEYAAHFQTKAEQLLKQRPETIVSAVASLVDAVQLDMSRYVEPLIPLAIRLLKSSNEAARDYAVSLLSGLSKRCSDPAALTGMVGELEATLAGKGGALTLWEQRYAAVLALRGVRDGVALLPPAAAADIAAVAAEALTAVLEKESHEATKMLVLAALGDWLNMSTVAPSKKLFKSIVKGMAVATKLAAVPYLTALIAACDAGPMRAHLAELVPELTKMVIKAQKKPKTAHPEAALALCLIMIIATDHEPTKKEAMALPAVEALSTGKCFAFAKSLADGAAPGGDGADGAELMGVAMLMDVCIKAHNMDEQLVPSALGEDGKPPASVVALVRCLLHKDQKAQKAATTALNAIRATQPESAPVLIAALWKVVCESADADAKSRAARAPQDDPADMPEGSASYRRPAASRILKALEMLLPEESPPALSFAHAMFISHHPLVAGSSKHADQIWASVGARFGFDEDLEEVLEEAKFALKDLCMSAALSNVASQRDAAHRVMGTLGLEEGTELVEAQVLPALLNGIKENATAIKAFTADDLAIYYTPEGELKGEREERAKALAAAEAAAAPAASRAPKSKKGKGDFGAAQDDAEWEAQVRAELEAKKALAAADAAPPPPRAPVVKKATASKKKTGLESELDFGDDKDKKKKKKATAGKDGKKAKASTDGGAAKAGGAKAGGAKAAATAGEPDDARTIKLREEDEVRQRVRGLLEGTERSLEAVSAVCGACEDLAHNLIHQILPRLLDLLAIDLMHDAAYKAMGALAACVDDRLQPTSPQLAASLRLACVQSPATLGKITSKVLTECLEEMVFFSVDDTEAEPFPADTYYFVWPILEAVLRASPFIVDAPQALMVLAKHAVVEADDAVLKLVRKAMIDTVLHVIATSGHPAAKSIDPDPADVLSTLCTTTTLTVGEWASMLRDGGLLGPSQSRAACLKAILAMSSEGMPLTGNPLLESRLWLSCHDVEEANAEVAKQIWAERGAGVSPMFAPPLVALLSHDADYVRTAACKAIAGALVEHPKAVAATLGRLQDVFEANLAYEVLEARGALKKKSVEELMAMPVGEETDEEKEAKEKITKSYIRASVAIIMRECGRAKVMSTEDGMLDTTLLFIVQHGLVDPDDQVHQGMLDAGAAIVDGYGADNAGQLLELLEAAMEEPAAKGVSVELHDRRREGTVVLLGTVAKHLAKGDSKVASIVSTLVESLSIPSESVQRSVANCLAPLVATMKDTAGTFLTQLVERCLNGDSYGDRRGGAYGVAALVKGLGIAALKQHDLIPTLEDACANGSPPSKQGALFAFELLCERLRLLFEPYVIVILPLLLKCFSDGSDHVRKAAHGAAKAIMKNLSQHGVKLVLPKILEALEDTAWRTKQAATQLLGAMAYCAPRQLGTCLPQIIPKLTQAFSDTHPKVRDGGKKALRDVRSVIRNPEVSSLSEVLLSALTEPAKHTKAAIEALLVCEFIHSIDAPSLALLVPVLHRGMRDRSADTKRKASLITGNMSSMISDAKDMTPYLPSLLPGLQETVLDPIPDVRSTAAKALGQMVQGIGLVHLTEVVPWLTETLKNAPGSVERSGAAQGLSEVMVALGAEEAMKLLQELLPLSSHPKVGIREGVLWLLSFLPLVMGRSFGGFIEDSFPVILSGLSDDKESVREVAMRAGQVLVSTQGKSHLGMILPALESGLFDDNWRIRQSSVQLLGDLLFLIGGSKPGEGGGFEEESESESEGEEEKEKGWENVGGNFTSGTNYSAASTESIARVLGPQRRASILATLYMLRSDTSAGVRQCTLQVWKTMVANTPKALREILGVVLDQIINALASGNVDKRTVAGRALGDVVKKLGERVLPEMVPFLRKGLETGDSSMRQGVCLGLTEVLQCATRKQIEDYLPPLVSTVQEALCDSDQDVRHQAAVAFQTLYKLCGSEAVDAVVPVLLDQVSDDTSGNHEKALFGLCQVLKLRSKELLPEIVPRLLATPMSRPHINALGTIAEVTGSSLHLLASKILPVLTSELVRTDALAKDDDADARELNKALEACVLKIVSAVEESGIQWFAVEMLKECNSEDPAHRKWGVKIVGQFIAGNQTDFAPQVTMLLKELVGCFTDFDTDVLVAVRDSLNALVKARPIDELMEHIEFLRNMIVSMCSDVKHRKGAELYMKDGVFLLPSFNVPKGIEPLLAIYQHALQNGSADKREAAASGIGEIVELTDAPNLKPFLIKITGPLIRVVGDRFPSGVKAAILQTLRLLLDKGGKFLKPFVPQLQTSFVKALSDPSKAVRDRGAAALGQLMSLSTRVDPLIADLTTNAAGSDSPDVQRTMLSALGSVFRGAGEKVSDAAKESAVSTLTDLLDHKTAGVREDAADALGYVLARMDEGRIAETVDGNIMSRASNLDAEWMRQEGSVLALGRIAAHAGPAALALHPSVMGHLRGFAAHDHQLVQGAACRSMCMLLKAARKLEAIEPLEPMLEEVLPMFADVAAHESADLRVDGCLVIKQAAKACPHVVRLRLDVVVPPLLAAVKDSNIRVKMCAERTLLHVLEINTRNATLDEYVASADMAAARFVRDYARRVLARLQADSGDEGE